MKLLDTIGKLLTRKSSLDSEWSISANSRLFSTQDNNGKTLFFSDQDSANAVASKSKSPVRRYDIFAPDAIISKVSGSIANPKGKKTLVAYTDGSYLQHFGSYASAYGVWCYCGDSQAEYAAGICDNAKSFGVMGGELSAAVVAIKVAIANGYKQVEIHYDFHGVAIYEEGIESVPNPDAKMYWMYEQYKSFLDCARAKIDVKFVKAKAHECVIGNEHADFLAHTHAMILAKYMQANGISSIPLIDQGSLPFGSTHKPLWQPKGTQQQKLQQAAARKSKITCKMNGSRALSCSELDRLLVSKKWGERLGLTRNENTYLRYIACGAWDHPVVGSCMQKNKKQLSALRAGCARKLGISESSCIEQVFIQMVRVVGCGLSIEETHRRAAEKKALRRARKAKACN